MKIIGITGGIGSGKSEVLKILNKEYHAYIVDADKLAHNLMKNGEELFAEIVHLFGSEVVGADGELDRNKMGNIVFQNKDKLCELNALVHPAVKKHIINDICYHKQKKDVELYVIEAALLIEDGYKEICDELWYVYSDKENRMNRLIKGRGGNRQKWMSIMQNQSDDEFYRRNCEHIVNNDENLSKTANIVKELLFSTR